MRTGIHISELTRIIYTFGNKRAKLLLADKNKSKLRLLAGKFRESVQRDEEAWAHEITGSGRHALPYLKLRSRLKVRLIDDLFHLEFQTGSALRKAVYRNYKLLFAIRTLLLL